MWYDMNGAPITVQQFSKLKPEELRLAYDELPDGRRVSTVLLGLDHSFGGSVPLIFETLVFPQDSWLDLAGARYSTKEDALRGHARILAECAAGKHKEHP